MDDAVMRYWAKVDRRGPDECWNWTASTNGRGYGKFWYRGSLMLTHRLALILSGVELQGDALACHRCDNRLCCNPSHLFIGSAADNTHDMIRKGRMSIGTHRPLSKLNPAKVRDIRRLVAAGQTQAMVGERFGVTQSTVTNIIRGKSWKHVS